MTSGSQDDEQNALEGEGVAAVKKACPLQTILQISVHVSALISHCK